ncbi:MAG: hypothetical protein R3B09_30300 [Nannocystaceae bacterium]
MGAAAITASAATTAEAADAGTQVDRVAALFDGVDLGAWSVDEVHPVRHGSIVAVMRTPGGERFHVDVLRRDPSGACGIAETPSFSLFVANRGDGETITGEDQGRGAMLLARFLSDREARLVAAGAPLPELLTHGERMRAFPDGRFFPRA